MIYGDRIRLRAPEREDIPQFVEWLNDPEVRQGLLLHLPLSQVEEQTWFENVMKKPAAEHPLVIEVQRGEHWVMVGNCGFHNIDWRCRSADVGIFIGEKEVWNQGYGTETMRLLLKHGFATLNLNRIALDVLKTNPRAIRAYENAGFVQEGIKRQAAYQGGVFVDILIMSVLREEWENKEERN